MPARDQQQRSKQQDEFESEAAAPAEQVDQPGHVREHRVPALEHRLVQRKIADSEQKDEQYYHSVMKLDTFVGRGWRFVDRKAPFVAVASAVDRPTTWSSMARKSF
jgi:hypothetical protein